MPAEGLLVVILTYMTTMPGCIRCLIYTRISKDKLGDGHGVANQLADLEKRAIARGWTVVYRLSEPAAEPHEPGAPVSGPDDHHDHDDGRPGDRNGGGAGGGPWPFSPPGPGKPAGRPPFPAKINLLVPAGTLLGWSAMPGEANREIIDPRTLRDLVRAASCHPATRWCVTLVGPDKTAMAHGCARGQHPWDPQATGPPPGHASPERPSPAPDAAPAAAQLRRIMQRLKATFEPVASGSCDHRHREDGYRPSRALGDLVRARTATCPAPGCGASSAYSDVDHTRAWPAGDTDECNLGPTRVR